MTALCVLLTVACRYDYRDRRIPNALIVLAAAVGVVWRFCRGGPQEMLPCFGGATLIMVLLYPFFKIGSVGAGDVKLLGVAAGYFPFEKVLGFLFFSVLIAAMISLLKMWKENSFGRRLGYLREYLAGVAQEGSWQPYPEKGDGQGTGICLSGPVLASVLLYLGGVY